MNQPAEGPRGTLRKVAYVCQTPEISGGGEESLLSLLSALGRRVRAVVVTPATGELSRRAAELGCGVETLPLPKTAAGLWDGTLGRLRAWLRAAEIDLVHVNAAGRSLFLYGLAARKVGIPLVWHARVAESEPVLDRLGAALATRIIATSRCVTRRFPGRVVRNKTAIIPNPVDLDRFHPGKPARAWRRAHGISQEVFLAGAIGRLEPIKRMDRAVEAAALIRAEHPLFRLAVIGEGPSRADLESLVRARGLEDAVLLPGWSRDPSSALAAMDVLLHPMPEEGFGRTIIEAMACGKPAVAADSGGAAELVADGETGLLTRPGDHRAMADAVLALIRDPGLRGTMGKEARSKAEALYEPSKVAERVAALYEEMLAGR